MARQGVQPMEASAEEYQRAFASPSAPGGGDGDRPRRSTMVAPMMDAAALPALAPPRDEAKVLQKITALAAAAGEDWYYRFPVNRRVKDDKGGWTTVRDWIEGPSIKCANNVARIFGNCLVQCRVGEETDDAWIFYARFIDRETGFVLERAFQQRKGQQSLNTKDPGRALDIVFQIGQSKSVRNVVCNALETFTERAFSEAKRSLVSRIGSKMEEARSWIAEQLAAIKVSIERVEYVHARKAKDWLAPDMALIYAEIQSVVDGMAHPDDLWPVREPEVDRKPDPAEQERAAKEEAERVAASNRELEEAEQRRAAQTNQEEKQQDAAPSSSPAEPERAAPDSRPSDEGPTSPASSKEEAPTRKRTPRAKAAEHDAAPQRAEPKAQGSAEPKPPADDQPRLMPYQSPPKFWGDQFIKLIRRMESTPDVDRLIELNAQNMMFIERTAWDVREQIRIAAEDHKAALAARS